MDLTFGYILLFVFLSLGIGAWNFDLSRNSRQANEGKVLDISKNILPWLRRPFDRRGDVRVLTLEGLLFQIVAVYCWIWVIVVCFLLAHPLPLLGIFLLGYGGLNGLAVIVDQRHKLLQILTGRNRL